MIPKILKMKNFLSHDYSEIDFDQFQSALILGTYGNETDQSNGAGKSSIFEAITWALFGRSRHKKVDGVVKRDTRSCRVEFSFWVDSNLYRVIRTRDKIVRDTSVELEQWDGTEFKQIDCDTNTITDKKIVDIINFNYDVFLNSVYFKQDDISMFATATPSKRKDVLKALLKMEKWDDYQKKAKDKAKTLSSKIEEKTQSLVPMIEIDAELIECKQNISEKKKLIKSLNERQSVLNSQLISKKSIYQTYYTDNSVSKKIKDLKLKLTSVKARLGEINSEIKNNDSIVKTNTTQVAESEQKIQILKQRIGLKNKTNLEERRSQFLTGKTKLQILADKIEHLKGDIKLEDDKCGTCKKPLTKKEIADLVVERKAELKVAEKTYAEMSDKLKRAEAKLKQLDNDVSIGNKAELEKAKTEIKISKLQNEISNALSNNNRLLAEKKNLNLSSLEKELSELKALSNKESQETLKEEIESIEQEYQSIKKKIDKLNIEYGSKIRRKNEIEKLKKDQAILQKEINVLKSNYAIYDKLKNYFGKDGVQSVIIENVIEELENYSNSTLAKICNEPTSISIKTQKQLDNGSWSETFDIIVKAGNGTDEFETFSGGEKFRISLALRLALSNILSKRMGGVIKFLLLDEVSSNLDNKGLEMFINIVKQLSEEMKILVITHSERLKEKFEDIIIVDKGPTGSVATLQ